MAGAWPGRYAGSCFGSRPKTVRESRYLQVEASNAPARRVYERLGFADAYAYHYRSPPAG